MLEVRGLTVVAPDGTIILEEVDLVLAPGRAVVLAGASGAGKSTLVRAVTDADAMRAEGFFVQHRLVTGVERVGLVPQRGAPFDHLDVAGNLALALREIPASHGKGMVETTRAWLQRLDLDPTWASEPKSVSQLSGGQAQRLAVARVLASGRSILVMDEPSVGLDPTRVAALAAQIRAACDAGAAVLVVTHDPSFAADFAEEAIVLKDACLHRLDLGAHPRSTRRSAPARSELDAALRATWAGEQIPKGVAGNTSVTAARTRETRMRQWVYRQLAAFDVLAGSVGGALQELRRHPRDYLLVLQHVLRQSLLRPLPFYATVSLLLGFTILYVITSFGRDLGPAAAVTIVGGMPALALAPPISAFLYVAASSNTTNAWLGSMRLSGQIAAMEALGVLRRTYLWGPAFTALALGYVVIAGIFLLGLVVGGWGLCVLQGVPDGWTILTRELVDPTPDRAPYVTRAAFLVVTYAVGIASDTLAKSDRAKKSTDDITSAMTASVVASTVWVVTLELLSLFVLRWTRGAA